jgi:hypothetical protein
LFWKKAGENTASTILKQKIKSGLPREFPGEARSQLEEDE